MNPTLPESVAEWSPPSWATLTTGDSSGVVHEHRLGAVPTIGAGGRAGHPLPVFVGVDDEVRIVDGLSIRRGVAEVHIGEELLTPAAARRAAELLVAAADLLEPEVTR